MTTRSRPDELASVPAWIRSLAEARPDGELLVDAQRRLSYREVERESAHLARGLLASGVGKGTRVALLMPNGVDWVLAWLAASRIGAIVIPLSTFYQARELHWVLRHADVHTLLTVDRYLSHDYLSRLESAAPGLSTQQAPGIHVHELPYLRAVHVWGKCERAWAREGPVGLKQLADETPGIDDAFLRQVEAAVHPADLAVIIYTSGSTAEPKGACHSHGTVVRHSRLVSGYLGGGPEDRMYAPMPFFWVGGFHRLLCIMQVGGAIVFLDAFDAGEVLDLVHRERITTLVVWPHQAKALAEHPSFRAADFARMHSAPYPLLPETRRPSAPDLIPNSIGMTETFAYHTVDPTGFVLPDDKRGACGHALPGMERRIFDPDTGQEVAAGEVGELRVRGFNLMQGLYKREREDVFEPDGFYRTGDRGRIDPDGVYFFEGRIGDMIKTGGANVSPREVEAVLNAFEEVEQAHVVGVADPDMGEIVVAAIVPSGAASLDADTLRGRLRAQLSAFKVPRKLVPCSLDDLPRTDAGKLHPGRLREWLAGRIAAES